MVEVKALRDGLAIPYKVDGVESYSEAVDKVVDKIIAQIAEGTFPYERVVIFDRFGDIIRSFEPKLIEE